MKIKKILIEVLPNYTYGNIPDPVVDLRISVLTGIKIYNFQNRVDEDHFEPLFDRLMSMAKEEIKRCIKEEKDGA